MKPILIDVDGVLLKWLDSFTIYMHHKGYKWIDLPIQSYDLSHHFLISKKEVDDNVEIFNDGHWEFGTLKPENGALKALKQFNNPLVAISSCSTNIQAIALRKANLYNYFGDRFKAVHCVGVEESKKTHLADYEPTIWIEDNYHNCIDGLEYGHKCILLTKPWNKNYSHPDITRCENWDQIVEEIKND